MQYTIKPVTRILLLLKLLFIFIFRADFNKFNKQFNIQEYCRLTLLIKQNYNGNTRTYIMQGTCGWTCEIYYTNFKVDLAYDRSETTFLGCVEWEHPIISHGTDNLKDYFVELVWVIVQRNGFVRTLDIVWHNKLYKLHIEKWNVNKVLMKW